MLAAGKRVIPPHNNKLLDVKFSVKIGVDFVGYVCKFFKTGVGGLARLGSNCRIPTLPPRHGSHSYTRSSSPSTSIPSSFLAYFVSYIVNCLQSIWRTNRDVISHMRTVLSIEDEASWVQSAENLIDVIIFSWA